MARATWARCKLVIRPHPLFDNGEEADQLRRLGPRVFVQRTGNAGLARTARTQNERQITECVNTFRHSDVVVNLSSTVTVDAAFFDHPVVNLDFDPEPGQPQQALVKDVNHRWPTSNRLPSRRGVLVQDPEEMVEAVRNLPKAPGAAPGSSGVDRGARLRLPDGRSERDGPGNPHHLTRLTAKARSAWRA